MTDMEREDTQQPQEQQQADGAGDARQQPSQEEWEAALEQAVAQRDEYLTMAQRTQAEFSNYRKRTEAARTEALDDGVREALSAMLPTIDNFERAVVAAREAGEAGALLDGVLMTQKLMLEAAAKMGLEEVPAQGQLFDPALHNAVMRADEGEPGMILEVFQKGYSARGKIIRYPMVKVAAE